MNIESIERTWPELSVKFASNDFGTVVVLMGKGAKDVANHLAKENYLNGWTDTQWRDVRHGLGYAVPLYDNPISAII